jgi:signal transduction histidine kinase
VSGWLASVRRRVVAPPALAVDSVIAVLCYLATVALPVKVARDGNWVLFVLATLASLPLVWRRRAPVPVATLVGAGTVGLAVTGALGEIPLPYGQLVATFTVAAVASPPWRLVTLAVTAVAVPVTVLLILGQNPANLGTAALSFVVAYALGTGVRARRDRIAMLEERTHRLAEAQHAAAARERERIARDIHDIVAHSVSLMVVQAEAGLVLAEDAGRASATFEVISQTGREAVTQLNRALGVLRGDASTRQPQPGLDQLPGLVEQARLAGLDARLAGVGRPRPVPADLAAAVYRLVQEAVTNTIKHAGARRVVVRLDWQDSRLRIAVSDDGRGTRAAPAGPGYGLVGMRERVRAFGGDLRTGAGRGGVGFQVVASLPLPAAAGEDRADG